MTTETEITEALTDGEIGTIFVEKTPFYATMGGQEQILVLSAARTEALSLK